MTTDIPTCTQCGKQHIAYDGKAQACKGHRSGQPDTPCTQRPMTGQAICYTHGGAAKQNRQAGARRRVEQEARQIMATLGDEPTDTDPVEGMHLAICWARTHMDWLRGQVQKLQPDAVVWGDRKAVESDMRGLTLEQRAEVNAWLKLYNEQCDRFFTYCARATAAGLAEREIRLAEKEGAMLGEVIRAVLADLELTPDQQAKALNVVPQHLRSAQEHTPSMN